MFVSVKVYVSDMGSMSAIVSCLDSSLSMTHLPSRLTGWSRSTGTAETLPDVDGYQRVDCSQISNTMQTLSERIRPIVSTPSCNPCIRRDRLQGGLGTFLLGIQGTGGYLRLYWTSASLKYLATPKKAGKTCRSKSELQLRLSIIGDLASVGIYESQPEKETISGHSIRSSSVLQLAPVEATYAAQPHYCE